MLSAASLRHDGEVSKSYSDYFAIGMEWVMPAGIAFGMSLIIFLQQPQPDGSAWGVAGFLSWAKAGTVAKAIANTVESVPIARDLKPFNEYIESPYWFSSRKSIPQNALQSSCYSIEMKSGWNSLGRRVHRLKPNLPLTFSPLISERMATLYSPAVAPDSLAV